MYKHYLYGIKLTGNFTRSVHVVTEDYTATEHDSVIASAEKVVITLPDAKTCPGREYIVCNRGQSLEVLADGTHHKFHDGMTAVFISTGELGWAAV